LLFVGKSNLYHFNAVFTNNQLQAIQKDWYLISLGSMSNPCMACPAMVLVCIAKLKQHSIMKLGILKTLHPNSKNISIKI